MKSTPLEQLQEYLQALTAAGIRATDDARDINPPCVLIRAPALLFRFGKGCTQADWTARLYLVNAGTKEALQAAIPLINEIQTALEGAIVEATPADFDLPDGGGPTPGYLLEWSTR